MSRAGLNLIIVLFATLVLVGCSSTKSKDDQASATTRVEDRSASTDSGDATEVRTQGLDDENPWTAAALDDPESPLSVRIIYFDYDSSTIRAEFTETVAAHAAYLTANPGVSVTLEGHADERGSREYNLALGERRALGVRRQLVLLGASAAQINTVSYGEERPAVEGHDEQSYGLNRRVELVY